MKNSTVMVLGLGALAAGAAVMMKKKTTSTGATVPSVPTSSVTPTATGSIPASATDWQAYVVSAIQSRDPEVMRAAAAVLRKNGLTTEAAALEATALAIESANTAQSTASTVLSSVPAGSAAATSNPVLISSPGVVEQQSQTATTAAATSPAAIQTAINAAVSQAVATATQAQQAAAGSATIPEPVTSTSATVPPHYVVNQAINEYFKKLTGGSLAPQKARYKEDKDKVKAWQAATGQSAIDGKYGVSGALIIAESGIPPVRPFYYSSTASKAAADKKRFKARMLELYALHPTQPLWLEASKVDSD